jgi:flagellar hook assembly protein FlgD
LRYLPSNNKAAANIAWNGKAENGEKLPNGIYLAKISSGTQINQIKLLLLK